MLKPFVAGAVFGALVIFVIGAGPNAPVVRPEYKLVQGVVFGQEPTLAVGINREIAAGWELVSVHHSQEQYGFAMMRKGK